MLLIPFAYLSRRRRLWLAYAALLFATTFFPTYEPIHTKIFTNIYGMQPYVASSFLVPVAFAVAIAATFVDAKYIKRVALGAAAFGIVIAFYVSGVSGPDSDPPNYYTVVSAVANIFAPVAYMIAIPIGRYLSAEKAKDKPKGWKPLN